MKALLYEPKQGGHSDVILSYVLRVLSKKGIQTEVLRQPLPVNCDEISTLRQIAAKTSCDLVHILTIDGMGRRWLKHARPWRVDVIPVIGTYYLFNNLHTSPNDLAWWWLLNCRSINHIFISDEFWSERQIYAGIRRQVSFLPDPYDPEEFEKLGQIEARTKVDLPTGGLIYLVFGDLSKRKGVAEVVTAFRQAMLPPNAHLVLAGKVPREDLQEIAALVAAVSTAERQIILKNEYIPESLVSSYFCAADFVICNYRPDFRVSSGTCTRAFAAERPVVAVSHGVVGRRVKESNLGLTFACDGGFGLAAALADAAEARHSDRYGEWQKGAVAVARERTLAEFARYLWQGYKKVAGVPE